MWQEYKNRELDHSVAPIRLFTRYAHLQLREPAPGKNQRLLRTAN